MDQFHYRDGELFCEGIPLETLGRTFGTPLFVYSSQTIRDHVKSIQDAFASVSPLICYAVKANSNLAILELLRSLGCGFDIVSVGELERVLSIGCKPDRIVFSGVGKRDDEMAAAMDAGVLLFNVESEAEVGILGDMASRVGAEARIAIRVNPDVDPKTHRYIATGQRESKFGVDLERASALAVRIRTHPALSLRGVQCHIGSQITTVEPHTRAVRRVLEFASSLGAAGKQIEWINMGGGYGIYYRDEDVPAFTDYAQQIAPLFEHARYKLIMEPGRVIVGNAGVMLTEVVLNKSSGDRRFVVVDAGMNDLIRPSLYNGYHRIWPARGTPPPPLGEEGNAPRCDVVGPVCESGDFFAKDRPLPLVQRGELLAVMSTGAYASTMASNYNDRPRPAEVLVHGERVALIRSRQTLAELRTHEHANPAWKELA